MKYEIVKNKGLKPLVQMSRKRYFVLAWLLAVFVLGCTFGFDPEATAPPGAIIGGDGQGNSNSGGSNSGGNAPSGEDGVVTQVVDGDTIEVRIGEVGYRVRYVGVNTPERDEACYQEAKDANAALVSGQTVRLVQDESNTDRYGRLLRYVYVNGVFVNEQLVSQGWAEAVTYEPDSQYKARFQQLEREAKDGRRGCHPTGVFNDGSDVR
jgi:endonuclease YncB( thermonuclease family)